MSACNCCEAPPCAVPNIECDSISASKSKRAKCGFGESYDQTRTYCNGTGIKTTVTYTVEVDGSCSTSSSNTPNFCGCATGELFSVTNDDDDLEFFKKKVETHSTVGSNTDTQPNGDKTVITVDCVIVKNTVRTCNDVDPETVYYGVGDGTAGGTVPNNTSSTYRVDYTFNSNWYEIKCNATQGVFSGIWTGTSTYEEMMNGVHYGPITTSVSDPCCNSGTAFDWCNLTGITCTNTDTYEDKVTELVPSSGSPDPGESTAELKSKTVAALSAYPETWDGSCSAFADLSEDEKSYTVRRFKWRLSHYPTGTCYLKVWLQTRFVPEGGGTPVLTPITPYTWNGTGNPCLTDDTKVYSHDDNIITGGGGEIMEPTGDGTTTVEVVKFSCIDGYTPPDDGTENGYPVP